jgi:hypothetical protein
VSLGWDTVASLTSNIEADRFLLWLKSVLACMIANEKERYVNFAHGWPKCVCVREGRKFAVKMELAVTGLSPETHARELASAARLCTALYGRTDRQAI